VFSPGSSCNLRTPYTYVAGNPLSNTDGRGAWIDVNRDTCDAELLASIQDCIARIQSTLEGPPARRPAWPDGGQCPPCTSEDRRLGLDWLRSAFDLSTPRQELRCGISPRSSILAPGWHDCFSDRTGIIWIHPVTAGSPCTCPTLMGEALHAGQCIDTGGASGPGVVGPDNCIQGIDPSFLRPEDCGSHGS
jgi:hypothetical protein